MKKQFVVVQRLSKFVHIHLDCATCHEAATIADLIHAMTFVYVTAFSYAQDTQSVIVCGTTAGIACEESLRRSIEEALTHLK